VIPAQAEYVRATSVEEALDALAEPDAKALAGGQSLLPAMKLRLARPTVLVDIGRLDLAGVATTNGELRVGALTTWAELAGSEVFRVPGLAAVAECAAGIGDLQVRNLGTLAGSFAHADPASDMPAVALALGARVVARSLDREREIATDDLFEGPFATTLAAGELITDVLLPVPPRGSGSAYASVEHPASGFALAGVAALVRPDGEATLAVTGLTGRPLLIGDESDLSGIEVAGDRFAPAEYRRHLAAVLCRRALETARARAQEDA